MKEYKIGEVFRHTDGKAYQCVEGETCEGCAFRCTGNDCVGPYCDGGSDGRPVKFIAVTKPVEGMLYRAKNGRMYRLAEGSHWDHWCACDDDPERSCAELDMAVFGDRGPRWYWALVEEEAPVTIEPPKRHIELAVVKVEGDNVTFRIVEQTHRRGEFSQQANTDEFKACNGISLLSRSVPQWGASASASELYCRGSDKEQDMCEITCTAGEFSRICEAISEYNDTDGRGYEKPWPQERDRYFYVTEEGEVDFHVFYRNKFNQRMQDFGNFFRTEEEAEAALERVKQALKSKNGAENEPFRN